MMMMMMMTEDDLESLRLHKASWLTHETMLSTIHLPLNKKQ